jgi:parvulin-like peptidyl-prolyl isomerase
MAKKAASKATKKATTKTAKKSSTKAVPKNSPSTAEKKPIQQEKKDDSNTPLIAVLIAILLIIAIAVFAISKINPPIASANGADLTITTTEGVISFEAQDNSKTVIVSQGTYDYISLLFNLNGVQTSKELLVEEALLREVLYANAKAAGITTTDTLDEELFNARLSAVNYTYAEFMSEFDSEIEKDFVIQEYFNTRILNKIPTQDVVEASHILICYKGKDLCSNNRNREEASILANDLLTQAQAENSESSFSKLAQAYSDGPSSIQGGKLLPFAQGEMVPEFDTTVFSMEVGEVAGLVETDYGFHIIRLDGKKNIPNPQASVQVLTDMKNAIMNAVEIQ